MLKIYKKFFAFCETADRNKFYRALVDGVLLALMEALKIPAMLLMIQAAIDKNITTKVMLQCFGILLFSVIVGALVKYRSTILQCEAGYGTAANKRIEIAEHMRCLPMGYFNKNSLGYITSVTTNTMENLADVATRVIMLTTQGILTTGIIALMLLFFDWRIGLIVVIGLCLFLLVNSSMQKKSQKVSPRKLETDTVLVEKVLEYIQGIAEVKSYNLTGSTAKKLNYAIDDNTDCNIELETTFIPYMTVQNAVTKLTGVIMILLSIYLYLQDSMSLIVCITIMISSFLIYSSLEQAGSYSSLLRVVDASVDKAQDILDLPGMDIEGRDITPADFNVDLEHVDFSYEKRKIIEDMSIHIPENTTTAIVGPSGGGKTTLCQLIARFWDVDRGSVSLGKTNVKDFSMDSLMKNFSFVFQNVYLFHDTIANNIRFGQENAPMEKVIEAAEKACCHDFIMELPEGYGTVIGEGGASLSGGEKQRISIARAIMKDSPVIILDEATANVDPENEKELVEAIEALTREKTIFMIAHRLKTVRNADQILVVDHGKIVQQGRHEELMWQDGIYRRFVNARELAAGWKL
ncbi:ABC transporter ATP-binding protein [Muricomes intestini]|uniref:ABC transporter ATP-binding protein n=1 Tax=Muricomes intestini TaxID=1796634 RepID=UPI002FE33F5A